MKVKNGQQFKNLTDLKIRSNRYSNYC